MTKKTMSALRWVFGLPLAIVAVYIFDWGWQSIFQSMLYNYAIQHPEINHIGNSVKAAIVNALLVFLSCWFIPSSKKYIGIGWLIFLSVHFAFTYFGNQESADYLNAHPLEWLVPILGLFAGFYLSYLRFKDKGWGLSVKKDIIDNSE